MELVARSEYCARNVSPTLVLRTHYTVSSSTGRVGFRYEHRPGDGLDLPDRTSRRV